MLTRMKGLALAASLLIVVAFAAATHQGVFAASPSSGSYDAFVAKLSANLGVSDPAMVDAAIKTSLKQMVDDSLASGAISSKKAASLKKKIDQSNDPGKLLGLDQFAAVKESASGNGAGNAANGTGAADDVDDDGGNAVAGDAGNGAVDDHGGNGGGQGADDAAGDDHGSGGQGADDAVGDDHGGAGQGADDAAGDDHGGASAGSSDDATGDDHGGSGSGSGSSHGGSGGDDSGSGHGGSGKGGHDD
jgi:hypothetical protein